MKEMKQFNFNSKVPYDVRIKIATKTRDFLDAAKMGLEKNNDIKYNIEVHSERNFTKNPDSVGVTLAYPSLENASHIITKTFSLDIGEKAFTKEVKKLIKELNKKIKGI